LVVTGDAVLGEEGGWALSAGNLRSQDKDDCQEQAY